MAIGSEYHVGESSRYRDERRCERERTPKGLKVAWLNELVTDSNRTEPCCHIEESASPRLSKPGTKRNV